MGDENTGNIALLYRNYTELLTLGNCKRTLAIIGDDTCHVWLGDAVPSDSTPLCSMYARLVALLLSSGIVDVCVFYNTDTPLKTGIFEHASFPSDHSLKLQRSQ
jgi:hypothetical protein